MRAAHAQGPATHKQTFNSITTTGTPTTTTVLTGAAYPAPTWSLYAISALSDVTETSLASGQILVWNGTKWVNQAPPGTGTVTSVGLTVPGFLSVSGSPITGSGTFAVSLATQAANAIFAGPSSGSAAAPTFRALVAADIPALPESQITNLTSDLSGKQPTGSYLTSLTGDVTASGPGSAAATLAASGVTAGTYGDSSHYPIITVDAKGRVTLTTVQAVTSGFTPASVSAPSSVTGTISDYAGTSAYALYQANFTSDVAGEAGGDLRWQYSTDGSTWKGPDGTSSTYYYVKGSHWRCPVGMTAGSLYARAFNVNASSSASGAVASLGVGYVTPVAGGTASLPLNYGLTYVSQASYQVVPGDTSYVLGWLLLDGSSGDTLSYYLGAVSSGLQTDSFVRANTTAGAAGTTTGAGNNWTDVQGGVYKISSNTLLQTLDSVDGSQYNRDFLLRPSSENTTNQEVTCNILYQSGSSAFNYGPMLRYQSSTKQYYWAGLHTSGGTVYLFGPTGATTITSTTPSPALINGHTYKLDLKAIGTSPTTLSLIVTDTSTSGTVATISTTDNTSALQTSGGSGITGNGNLGASVTYSQAQYYAATTTPNATTLVDAGAFGSTAINTVTFTRAWANTLTETLETSANGSTWTAVTLPTQSTHGGTLSYVTTTVTLGSTFTGRYIRYSASDSGGTNTIKISDFRCS